MYSETKASQIEKSLQNEKEIISLLNEYAVGMKLVEEYGARLRNHMLDTPDDLNTAILELGGWFVSFNTVYTLAETLKMAAEEDLKNKKKQSIVDPGDESLVQAYRRVRNIFGVCCENCEKIISICQSRMRSLDREKTLKYD